MNAQRSIFKNYTVEDGLVANPVRRVYQDSKGFIWIATLEGLSKYDGYRFTNYNTANGLSHNMVNDMYESADGKLYVAENDGTIDILQMDAIVKKAAFRDVVINQFSVLKNNDVMAATDLSGLHQIKNGKLTKPSQSFAYSTYNDFADLNDSLLIGGSEGALRILNKQFGLYSEIKQPKELLTFKIFKDSKNRVWLGTNNGLKLVSTFRKNNQAVTFILLPEPFNISVLKTRAVSDMLEDANQNLWIATNNGLVKIYPNGNWQLFSEKDGLPSADITCVYQDKEKNIWIGTSLGLAKLVTKNDIHVYTIENGLASHGATFLQPLKNNLFLLSTDVGIQLYNSTTGFFSSVHSQNNFFYYGIVQNSRPLLFFGYKNKLGKYDSKEHRIDDCVFPVSPDAIVYCSIMDANGIIFSGTQTGLLIRSGQRSWYENKFPYRITSLLLDAKGFLWIGTWDNGLYRIHYEKLKNNSGTNPVSFSVDDFSYLLPDRNIRCLFEDSKRDLWVGTRYGGLFHLINDLNNNRAPFVKQHFDLRQGLMSNFIRAIAEDKKSSIWIGSDLGIDKLVPSDTSFRIFNFSRINNYFAPVNAILPVDDHYLWLTTANGLANIIDGGIENTPASPAYITSVDLGDTSFKYSSYHTDSKVRLKYYENQARFEFSSPAFINEKQIFYSYRLLGSTDTIWSKPANLHTVSFASLRPGKYRFELRTMGWDEKWGLPVSFEFSVQPPYWQTWWFYLLVGCVVMLVLYSLYRYRIRQLLSLQKMRNRIATDLHDDIGSTLTNINMLSEISKKNLEQPKEAEKFLQRISEEVTSSSQALNDIIWNVNSRNDSMEETMTRMRRYAAELFDSGKTICHLTMDESSAAKKINMEQRRDVYLIYKESMNNIFKHASASNVWINVKWQNEKLHLKIKDDGRGFETAVVTNRNGLRNIHSRAEKWKGSASVETSPGKGTLIQIILPVSG